MCREFALFAAKVSVDNVISTLLAGSFSFLSKMFYFLYLYDVFL